MRVLDGTEVDWPADSCDFSFAHPQSKKAKEKRQKIGKKKTDVRGFFYRTIRYGTIPYYLIYLSP